MNASGNRRGHFGFQLQMIAYTLASMFLTALTLLVIGFAVYGVLVLVQDNPDLAVPGEDKGYYKEYLNRIENVEDLSGIAAANSGMVEFTRKFAAYLAEITVGIRRFAAGEPGARIVVRQANELTQIAESFNAMAEELEEIETEEKKNEGAKNDLITSIAHDLRTPLTSVIGYLELVTEKDVDEETRRHYISVAYRKAKRLQCLTDDLFNYIKYGSSELTLTLAPIDAIKMMEQLTEEAYPAISENRLELVLEKELDRAVVEADGTLLARAFSNLLGNAIKYGRDGKRLFLQMGQETPETVSFHIINFGEVIPTEDLERIFERFYRVDAARTEEQGGTGLGLAIAKNIIERHGGTISVKSDLSGTEFIVVLPLAPVKGDEI